MFLDKKVLNILLKNAEKAFNKGEIPVSAVILDEFGRIISYSCNNRQKKSNVLGHAEVNAIIKAEKKINDWRLDGYTMIVTLEPCNMCSVIIKECRLDKVYYFLSKKNEDSQSDFYINKEILKGYDEFTSKFKKLLTDFFNNKR